MTTPKHTPEPWAYNEHTHRVWANTHESEKYNNNDAIICELSHYTVPDEEARANAARIVECVNAFKGIPNPAEWLSRQSVVRAEVQKLNDNQINMLNEVIQDLQQELKYSKDCQEALEKIINEQKKIIEKLKSI